MPLNFSKLEKVVKKSDGNIEARCPACAEQGNDGTGNHLIVYPDGKFGCVANPGDKQHNKAILRLAGGDFAQAPETPKLKINRLQFPPVRTIMVLPRPTAPIPQESVQEEQPMEFEIIPIDLPKETNGPLPKPRVFPEGMSDEVKAFLSR